MKFELNEYHRNVSNEEFITDVQSTAKKLGKSTLTGAEYSEYGTYHSSNTEVIAHKTNRDINLRLRFKVMQRDNFKCCACGASPAKNPAVELHIDHIIPWSKGGETIIENLQTLCSKCNLGKSDML